MKEKKKILYFDCSSGISGDMTLGALIDLGADRTQFLEELKKLNLDGYEIAFETTQRNAITATHVNVILTGQEAEHVHDHEHMQGHEHTHDHEHMHDHEHTHDHEHMDDHKHTHDHEHIHDHEHTHDHEHMHDHGHGHMHRSFKDIRKMIQDSTLEEDVKDLSLRIFTRVAQAEAKVHHKDVEDVQFHEVGAVDSIVDIVGSAILISMIKPDRICASAIQDGHGFIHCQHGMLSVPVPAVCEIFAASNAVVRQIDVDTELVTPTGAAIVSELAESFGTMPAMTIEKMGWGAGTKVLKIPNLLKVTLGYEMTDTEDYTQTDEVMVLETNLDDCTGEMLGAAMEIFMENGALDAFYTPIYMKKNRPAWCLTVLAKPSDTAKMENLMFLHTTTIGIRKHLDQRTILKREKAVVQTPFGELQVKRVKLKNGYRDYPEYESAKKLAVEAGKPLWEILKNDGKSGELV